MHDVESTRDLAIRPVAPRIGARVSGVDLARPLTGGVLAALQSALARYQVLFFRDQALDEASLLAAARQFGAVTRYPFGPQQDVIHVTKQPAERVNFGGIWHTDTPYLVQPAGAALLYAVTVPPTGGDTLFASMTAAFELLSPGLQRLLGGLRAVNRADKQAIAATRGARQGEEVSAVHPVIRRHPVTDHPILYVSRAHTTCFEGCTEAESEALLDYLFDLQNQPEITCRFCWQPGSLALWDNRACQHYPLNDYHGQYRDMLRVSLAGEHPIPASVD